MNLKKLQIRIDESLAVPRKLGTYCLVQQYWTGFIVALNEVGEIDSVQMITLEARIRNSNNPTNRTER